MAQKIAPCMTNCDFDHFDSSIWQPPTRSLLDGRSLLKQNFRTHPVLRNFLETLVLPLDAATVRGFGPGSPTRVRSLMSTDYGEGLRFCGPGEIGPPQQYDRRQSWQCRLSGVLPRIISARSHDKRCLEGSRLAIRYARFSGLACRGPQPNAA